MVFLFSEPLGRPRPRFGSSTSTHLLVKFNEHSNYLLTCQILVQGVALFEARGRGTAGRVSSASSIRISNIS